MKRTTTSISTQPLNKAVFLDRDGTINSDEGHYYIYKPEDFVFNPGVIEGLKRLQKAGYLLIVITNQGGIAKGIYTREDMFKVMWHGQRRMQQRQKPPTSPGAQPAAPVFSPGPFLQKRNWSHGKSYFRSGPPCKRLPEQYMRYGFP